MLRNRLYYRLKPFIPQSLRTAVRRRIAFRLFASRRKFKQSAARINDYLREWKAAGFRSGFMLRELDWLHDLDVQYDASTFDTDPFEPQPEGHHTIFPFWVPRPNLASSIQ